MRTFIPNMFTSANLACGVFAILKTIEQEFFTAGVFIILAMVADAFDGRAARYFGVSGDFGKELDSLCDAVSFGVAPAILLHQMYMQEIGYLSLVAVVIFPVCAVLRLARFNISTTTVQGYFMGLPAPAGGCILAAFAMSGIELSGNIVAFGVIFYALLMYSKIRYPDFKGKGNPIRKPSAIIAILLIVYLVWLLPVAAIPFSVFFSYSIMGFVNFIHVKLIGGYGV